MYKWDGLFATRSIEHVIGHVCPQCRSGERGVRKIAKNKKRKDVKRTEMTGIFA